MTDTPADPYRELREAAERAQSGAIWFAAQGTAIRALLAERDGLRTNIGILHHDCADAIEHAKNWQARGEQAEAALRKSEEQAGRAPVRTTGAEQEEDASTPDHIRVVREALTWLSAGRYNIRTEDAPPELDRRAEIARAALPALDAIVAERLALLAERDRLEKEREEWTLAVNNFADKLMETKDALRKSEEQAGRLAEALSPFAAAYPRLREGHPRHARLWPPLELVLCDFERAAEIVGGAPAQTGGTTDG